ncbi:MAG: acyltransferase family protein [Leucothrix sp.]
MFVLLVWLPYIIAKYIAFHKLGLGIVDPAQHNGVGAFFSNLFLVNALNVHDYLSWNFPAWSISVEFFTYLIFFACISLFRQFNDLVLCLGLSALFYFLLYTNNPISLLKTYDWGLVRCLGGFFLGAAVYRLTQLIIVKFSTAEATLVEVLSVGLMIVLVSSSITVNYQLAAFGSFALVILIFSVQEVGLLTRMLTLKPLLFLGALSYSIYMIHALIFVISATLGTNLFKIPTKIINNSYGESTVLVTPYADLITLVLLTIVIGLSYLTYRYIEVPWRDKFRAYAKKPQALKPTATLRRPQNYSTADGSGLRRSE